MCEKKTRETPGSSPCHHRAAAVSPPEYVRGLRCGRVDVPHVPLRGGRVDRHFAAQPLRARHLIARLLLRRSVHKCARSAPPSLTNCARSAPPNVKNCARSAPPDTGVIS